MWNGSMFLQIPDDGRATICSWLDHRFARRG
jgi:hypothetical protein